MLEDANALGKPVPRLKWWSDMTSEKTCRSPLASCICSIYMETKWKEMDLKGNNNNNLMSSEAELLSYNLTKHKNPRHTQGNGKSPIALYVPFKRFSGWWIISTKKRQKTKIHPRKTSERGTSQRIHRAERKCVNQRDDDMSMRRNDGLPSFPGDLWKCCAIASPVWWVVLRLPSALFSRRRIEGGG